MFSSQDIDRWVAAQIAQAPTPDRERIRRIAALLHANTQESSA